MSNVVQMMQFCRTQEEADRVLEARAAEFFFFKQTTAYEFSECDWSSDVCSSDLSTRLFFILKQKTAYEISECDWSSDVCSSDRSEEHTSELQSHSEISYAVFCL